MVISPVGLGTKNHCAVEDQQQFSSQSVNSSLNKIFGIGFALGFHRNIVTIYRDIFYC
jgi:hypothetical protein